MPLVHRVGLTGQPSQSMRSYRGEVKKRVLILGAGFGGLELATRLSEELADAVQVTLIDQNDSFVFGFSKLDVMFGLQEPGSVRLYYRDIVKPAVAFKQETIRSIEPQTRRVTTDVATYEADILVVALGADLDPGATPGLLEAGYEFYSVPGAEQVRDVLPGFEGGVVLIGVLGPIFKCPPAPFEAAMMLHDYLSDRGIAERTTIRVLSPMSAPVPISKEVSEGILDGLSQRGIEFWPGSLVTQLDATSSSAVLEDGRSVPFDLFLGVPVHRAPAVIEASPLAVEGWIPVDTATFATSFDGVYAVGDVTNAPVPRAGVFAEGEAGTLADHLIAGIRGSGTPHPYDGTAICYVEFGGGTVGRVEVDFLSGPAPSGRFQAPSLEIGREKSDFAARRRERWFGHSETGP